MKKNKILFETFVFIICTLLISNFWGILIYAEEITAKKVNCSIIYEDRMLFFKDQSEKSLPVLEYNDSVYVPIRSFCRYMGKGIDWDYGEIYIYNLSENYYEGTTYGERQGYEEVSMIELIAYPEKYDGKNILVSGVINVGFESNMIFLTKEDKNYVNLTNAVCWLIPWDGFGIATSMWDFYDKIGDISGRYIEMEGTFKAQPNQYPRGVLTDVKSIYYPETL